jgi:hypothetical protein
MKKFFLFTAAVVAALSINAAVYDLAEMNFAQSDLSVTGGSITDNASKSYFEVKNNAGEVVELTLAQLPNIKFTYKNSEVKTAFKVYYITENNKKGKIQMDGNQRDVVISGLNPGDKIVLWVNSKGSTGAQFVDDEKKGTAFTGCVAVDPSAPGIASALPGKDNEEDAYAIELQAVSNEAIIRETVGGYVLSKIQVGGGQGVENVNADVKTVKTFENGQLVIIKNGVRYNALGAQL